MAFNNGLSTYDQYTGLLPSRISNKLSNLANKFLNRDVKKLVEAGILDKDLELTHEGEILLLEQYLLDNKDFFVDVAKEMIKKKEEDEE